MDVKGERIVVSTNDRDDQGKQIDPEERPLEHTREVSIPLSLSNGQTVEQYTKGQASGGLAGSVAGVISAGEFATAARHRCRFCANYDKAAFKKWKADVEASQEPSRMRALNDLRAKIVGTTAPQVINKHSDPQGELDVEHALNEFGICKPLSEILKDMVFVWPDAGCPATYPNGLPFEDKFKPRSTDAAKAGAAGYDAILKAAQGQVKRSTKRIDVFGITKK